jgi:transcription antitermination factor NusG
MVASQLGALDIPHWLPLIELRKRWSDRFMTIREPLFPGYLFVSPPMEELLSVVRCRGVVRVVGSPGRPHPVEPRELEAVRAALAGRLRCDPCPYLRIGGEVEVTRGPLKGFRGILVRKGKNCKLVLSVRLISQSVAVEINASDAQGV